MRDVTQQQQELKDSHNMGNDINLYSIKFRDGSTIKLSSSAFYSLMKFGFTSGTDRSYLEFIEILEESKGFSVKVMSAEFSFHKGAEVDPANEVVTICNNTIASVWCARNEPFMLMYKGEMSNTYVLWQTNTHYVVVRNPTTRLGYDANEMTRNFARMTGICVTGDIHIVPKSAPITATLDKCPYYDASIFEMVDD